MESTSKQLSSSYRTQYFQAHSPLTWHIPIIYIYITQYNLIPMFLNYCLFFNPFLTTTCFASYHILHFELYHRVIRQTILNFLFNCLSAHHRNRISNFRYGDKTHTVRNFSPRQAIPWFFLLVIRVIFTFVSCLM